MKEREVGEGRGRGGSGSVGDLFMSWCSSLLLTPESGLARIPSAAFRSPTQSFDLSPSPWWQRSSTVHAYNDGLSSPGFLCHRARTCVDRPKKIPIFPPRSKAQVTVGKRERAAKTQRHVSPRLNILTTLRVPSTMASLISDPLPSFLGTHEC